MEPFAPCDEEHLVGTAGDREAPPPSIDGHEPVVYSQRGSRRTFARYAADVEVDFGSEHNFYAGLTENLSVGGLFIATHQFKKVGERVDVTLHLPDGGPESACVAEVRWIREYSETSDSPPGMGVRFLEIEDATIERIKQFLAHRDPLLWDD